MSGRSVTYTLRLDSNVTQSLQQSESAALKLDNSMWQLQKTMSAFGIGLGAHYLVDAAKDWTQGAADFETAMLRIKNASYDANTGLKNQLFINNEVDQFKLKLEESLDAYGSFLFKIKNANLSNSTQNSFYENILTVGKVAGLPQQEIDATVRNMGILLGEGVLEARHLRQLSYVHPQIVPFLADALGIKGENKGAFDKLLHGNTDDKTAQQELSLLISSGKLTKLGINSDILIEAMQKYSDSVKGKLPETLGLVQSELNSLSVTWERFKNSLVLGEKPELVSLFHDLEDGIKWLSEHEEDIIKTGKAIFELAEIYVKFKIVSGALDLINNTRLAFSNKFVSAATSEALATEKGTAAIREQEIEMEKLDAILTETYVKMDLFTKSQIQNVAASESTNFESGLFYQRNGSTIYPNKRIDFQRENSVNKFSGIDKQQGGLFSESEMERMKKSALFSEEEMFAMQLGAGKLPIKGTNGGYGGKLGSIIGGSTAALAGSGLLEVAVVMLGIEAISGIAGAITQHNSETWGSEVDKNKAKSSRIFDEFTPGFWQTALLSTLHESIFTNMDEGQFKSGMDFYTLKKEFKENNEIFTKEFEDRYYQYVKLHTSGSELYESIEKLDQIFGRITHTINEGVSASTIYDSYLSFYAQQMLSNNGILYPTPDGKPISDVLKNKTNILSKDTTSHIKGNSSNYVTININEMNGIKGLTQRFDHSGNPISEEKVATLVGTHLVKILTGVVNDSQLVGHHR